MKTIYRFDSKQFKFCYDYTEDIHEYHKRMDYRTLDPEEYYAWQCGLVFDAAYLKMYAPLRKLW